jgi:hypothetical protein
MPVNYTAARKALALATKVDEVKKLRDQSAAMEVYAAQAKDGELMAYATEIRKRAERRLGELMAAAKAAGEMAKGAKGNPKGRGAKIVRVAEKPAHPTLADQGIDKNLADRARKAAALSEVQFETSVTKAVKVAVASVEGSKEIIKEARAEQQQAKRENRATRERALGDKLTALPEQRFGVIVADPEWQFEPWSLETGMDRAAANHYPTSGLDVIKARDVPSISADDCALFLWATIPMLPHALAVMAAWGFGYKSHYVWGKDKRGTGYWSFEKHEVLLTGTRGKIPCPAPGQQ